MFRCLVVVLAGCALPSLSTERAAIRGGVTDGGDPAVVSLSVLGVEACTAILISTHTLLTAGHCDLDLAAADFGDASIDIAMTVVHPQSTGEGTPYDLALMKLASDPGIAPLALSGSAPEVGRPVRHVGFGVTDDSTGDGGGVKRTVTYLIHRIDGMLVYSGAPGEETCVGDSGGPGLVTTTSGAEVVAMVVSDGPDCQLSQDGWDNRVDLVRDWIVATTSSWDAPPTFDMGSSGSGSSGSGSGSDGGGDAPGASSGSASGGCATTDASASGLSVLIVALRRRRRSR